MWLNQGYSLIHHKSKWPIKSKECNFLPTRKRGISTFQWSPKISTERIKYFQIRQNPITCKETPINYTHKKITLKLLNKISSDLPKNSLWTYKTQLRWKEQSNKAHYQFPFDKADHKNPICLQNNLNKQSDIHKIEIQIQPISEPIISYQKDIIQSITMYQIISQFPNSSTHTCSKLAIVSTVAVLLTPTS